MQIIIAARHTEIPDSLREHIEERFGRLDRFDDGASRMEVTVSEEKQRCLVEANVSSRLGFVHAGAEAGDFRTAVDRLYEKLSRQLKSRRDRARARKGAAPELSIGIAENPET
ncbi:MAG: ribosome-associated translation inhibitor RaiA [Candidatus Palauibacterales bacterium]|jgi:ribosome hibernation promoting factor|nr:ribosome-associated translation inhibitor RaiA [Candidatus Palauibacterales bacterium]MDP2483496.1 ribosome-associated translation inhibitor RaiA [Candidatus Palauibacterales bacterium]